MVYIEIAQPERLKPTSLSKLSAFVSFEYESNLVSIIKSMGTRVYIPDKKTWEIPESAVPMLMSRLRDYDVLLRGEMRHETPESHAQLPSGFVFTTKPYKHQMEGVIYGLEHESFLLGDDQGMGKTKELIDLAMCRKQTDGIKHCLIICGINGNKYNWADEVKIHSREDSWILGTRFTKRPPIKMIEGSTKDKMEDLNDIPHQFFWITNIETLRGGSFKEKQGKRTVMRFPIAEKIQELCDRGIIGMIAFDEAHKCLDGNARVSTDLGDIPISELVDGRINCSIKSLNEETGEIEFQPVSSYFTNFNFEPQVEIYVNCGGVERSIQLTASHLLMTRRGWVKAKDIQENDEIFFTDCLSYANIR